jgi:hypothetical protein
MNAAHPARANLIDEYRLKIQHHSRPWRGRAMLYFEPVPVDEICPRLMRGIHYVSVSFVFFLEPNLWA